MTPSKVLSTNLQRDVEFSVVWKQNHAPDFIQKVFLKEDMKVSMDHTDISKLFEEDDHYRQVILDKNLKLHKSLCSHKKGLLAFSLTSSAEERSMIKVCVKFEEYFKHILSQFGQMTFLRIKGSLKAERKMRDDNFSLRWGNNGVEQIEGEVIFHEEFDRRFDCSGNLQLAELFRFSEENLVRAVQADDNSDSEDEGDSEIKISVNLDIDVEWQRPPRVFYLDSKQITQTLYEDDNSKDLIIETPDGEIKCHSCVLMARSEVFRRMLSPETGMIESKSQLIVLKDMSLSCLKSFISLLYGNDMSSETISFELTVELFVAAEKYDVTNLLDSLRMALMERGKEWYTPDAILDLFRHVSQLQTEKALRNHLLQVMNRMTPEIKNCERYQGMTKPEVEALIWALHEHLQESSN